MSTTRRSPATLNDPDAVADDDELERRDADDDDDDDAEDEDGERLRGDGDDIDPEHVCCRCGEPYASPRVLSCLHVFCEACVSRLAAAASDDADASIVCPECAQETRLLQRKGGGAPALSLCHDYVLQNMMDMRAIARAQIDCTSCKAREKAVARCSDCANFLCPNCVTAHQYMRCFENHTVVSFEDIIKGDDEVNIHKPIFCTTHPSEPMKYYCNTCQVPICSECMMTGHKQPSHDHERIADCEFRHRDELKGLVAETQGKRAFCEEATTFLEGKLSDLQQQYESARGLIDETLQSYRAVLQRCHDDAVERLADAHRRRELAIMEMCNDVDNTAQKIEQGSKFTERLLRHGNSVEVMSLKRLVGDQLLYIINNTPNPDMDVELRFVTNPDAFRHAVESKFGYLEPVKGETNVAAAAAPDVAPDQSPPPAQLRRLTKRDLAPGGSIGGGGDAVAMVPVSIASRGITPPVRSEFNNPRDLGSPSVSDCPSAADVDAPFPLELQGMNKMPAININPSGQLTVNGQVVADLSVNNMAGLSQLLGGAAAAGQHNLQGLPPDLLNLLNSVNAAAGVGSTGSSDAGSIGILSSGKSSPLHQMGTLDMSLLNLNGGLSSSAAGVSNMMSSSPAFDVMAGNSFAPQTGLTAPGMTPGAPLRNSSSKLNTMQIRCKFGQLGPGKTQFNSPHGFCLGIDEDIVVADTNNHRIQVFEKTGEFKYQFGIPGREEGQLWYPRKVAVIRTSGKFVVCDRGNERSRMQIFTKNGHFIKKIAIRYIDIVAGLAITHQGHVVAVDSVSPTVFRISESGDLLKWFDCSDYMREPSDIAISGKNYFVCDFKGHCVVEFDEEGHFLRRIGCENITCFPNGIDISDAGDVLVGDSHGNRFHVAVFQRDGSLLSEFECPYVKVSRCCGLKITSEGYIVTLAKNNHHVLVLNTLYIM